MIGYFHPVTPRRVIAYDPFSYKTLTLESFKNWPVSNGDYSAIKKINQITSECKAKTLFQIAWSPILYEITGLKNSTRFDVPYSDVLSLKGAEQILLSLQETPPDLIIMEVEEMHKISPWRALGMKLLYKKLSLEIIPSGYVFIEKIHTDFKEWEICCRK